MNRLAFFAMVLCWGAVVAPAQDARSQVVGTVRSATTGEVIAGVAVTLLTSADQKISRRTITGPDGNFAFSGLTPGQYGLTIGKRGYHSLQAKVPVTVRDSAAGANLVATLWPYGAISGRVVDWEGEPVAEAEVRAYAIAHEPNGVTLSLAAKGRSGDLGQYRLFDLPAGKYLLQVSPPRTTNSGGQFYADTPAAYYPGATAPSQAVPIELNRGAEITSADVWIPPDRSYTIAGVIWDAEGEGPCSRCAVQVVQHDGVYRVSLPQAGRVSPDGTFLLRGLTSGDYALIASRGSSRMTQTEVSIRDWHVEDARLTLGLQHAVSGEIVLENPPDGIDVTNWSPRLSPVNLPAGWPQEQGEITADRQFTIPEVPPARYRLELRGLPPGAYLKALRGGQLLPNPEIVVSPDAAVSGLQPVVGFDSATLLGKVLSPENAALGQARIFLLPQLGQTGSQLPKTTETNPDGSFSLVSVAPGSYTVYALPATTSLQIFDPGVQAALGRYARQVDLDPKETMNVAVPLAPQPP